MTYEKLLAREAAHRRDPRFPRLRTALVQSGHLTREDSGQLNPDWVIDEMVFELLDALDA